MVRPEPRGETPHVSIVGGGVAGLYTAYRLAGSGYSVELFEQSDDRLGGRIATRRYPETSPNFWAEFGPMRFELDLQPRLLELCEHLGLEFTDFAETGAPRAMTEYEMTDVEKSFVSVADLHEWAVLQMFFGRETSHGVDVKSALLAIDDHYQQLSEPEQIGPCQLAWLQCYMERRLFLFEAGAEVDPLDRGAIDSNLSELREKQLLFGEGDNAFPMLRDIGLWHGLSEVVTPGALAKIRESGTFYHCVANNPSAVEWGIFWLRQASVLGRLSTFAQSAPHGVSTLVELLELKLDSFRKDGAVQIHRGTTVLGIEPAKRPTEVVLQITQADRHSSHAFNIRTDHVVLALPQLPLRRLQEHFPEEVKTRIEAVEPLLLLKAFVITTNPWWRPGLKAQSYAWRVPTRELHFYPSEDPPPQTTDGMIMLYTDQPAIHYWDVLLDVDERRTLVWKVAGEDGFDPQEEVDRNPFGVLALLIRRLLIVPHPGLPGQINLLAKAIRDKLGGLENQLDAKGSHLLGFAQQLVELVESEPSHKTLVDAVLLEQIGPQLPADWSSALKKALELRETGCIDPVDVAAEAAHVLAYGIRDWSAEPFGGAAHLWKPGASAVLTDQRSDPLLAFALRERAGADSVRNMHICGEAYSGHQGFIEGALDTAQQVVEIIIGKPLDNLSPAKPGLSNREQANRRQLRTKKFHERLENARPKRASIPEPLPTR